MPGSRAQSGQAIVLIAVMLTVLIGMTAIAIDGARAYALRRDLQDAADAAGLAAADTFQQTGSYSTAEQAATASFGKNVRLYAGASCSPGYGAPGAAAWTVTCTYPDGTVLTDVARSAGAQGARFTMSATRSLQLQFGRILTNGTTPTLAATANADVNDMRYTPAIAALAQSGCGGTMGSAISVNAAGTLSVLGDLASNGSISVSAGNVSVAGDIVARCQASVPGPVSTTCYPSGAAPPCTFPDVAGATRAGFRLSDPGYPAPAVPGGSQASPGSNVVVPPGIYGTTAILFGGGCWFLPGGVYEFSASALNFADLVSNELKPPDEPVPGSNTVRSTNQFWDTNGVRCAGAAQLAAVGGIHDLPLGNYAFELTSMRSDSYSGVSYTRESAPSRCYTQSITSAGQNIQVSISNVPGATAYDLYASPPAAGGTCSSPFGFVTSIPVTGTVQNNSTGSCPIVVGPGCSLGNESMRLDSTLIGSGFAPNPAAAPWTTGAYPPDGETAPLAAGLPNQNPSRGTGTTGDRANENACSSTTGVRGACPGRVTPGAVELYFPAGSCLFTGNSSDTYLFSGYQYNWVSVFEPPGNTCSETLGAHGNSAFIGLFYAPGASLNVNSPYIAEAAGVGGLMARSVSFTATLPSITYRQAYAPVPPAARVS